MKKLLAIILSGVMALSISACSKVQNEKSDDASSKSEDLTYNILDESLQAEEYAIAFKKDNTQVEQAIVSAFTILQKEGKIAEISKKWFGKDIVLKMDTNNNAELTQLPQDKKTFTMGLDDSFPPMGFRNSKNEIDGFDVDVAKAVCEKLNVELILQPIDWSVKELELNSGNIDCIWNGLTRTDEREEKMLLSPSYLANNQVIVVIGKEITSKADLKGKKVAVQTGSSAQEALNKDDISKEVAEIVEFADNVTALQDLKSQRIDAVILDEVVARYYCENENSKAN